CLYTSRPELVGDGTCSPQPTALRRRPLAHAVVVERTYTPRQHLARQLRHWGRVDLGRQRARFLADARIRRRQRGAREILTHAVFRGETQRLAARIPAHRGLRRE